MNTETAVRSRARRRVVSIPFLARQPWVGLTAFVLGAGGFAVLAYQVLSGGPLSRWDEPAASAVHAWATAQGSFLVLVMRFFSAFGRDGLALIALLLFIFWARRGFTRELGWLIVGVLGGELLFQISSNLIGRPRPDFKDPFETLIGPGFPSGHATTNILLAWLVLAFLLPRLRSKTAKIVVSVVTLLFVVGILFSRLFLGLHYPSDLVAGVFLGLSWGGLVYTLIDVYFYRRQANRTPGKTNRPFGI